MEASYPTDQVTRFAGTNKNDLLTWNRVILGFICSIHCGYMKYLYLAANARKHTCAIGQSSSSLAEFPRQRVYMVKYSSCLSEITGTCQAELQECAMYTLHQETCNFLLKVSYPGKGANRPAGNSRPYNHIAGPDSNY